MINACCCKSVEQVANSSEEWLVDPKTKGVQNVLVFLVDAEESDSSPFRTRI